LGIASLRDFSPNSHAEVKSGMETCRQASLLVSGHVRLALGELLDPS
jgi:hypothetical protein